MIQEYVNNQLFDADWKYSTLFSGVNAICDESFDNLSSVLDT